MQIKTYEDLKVWRKSHDLVLEIYKITNDFPKEEIYGLTSQIRRSSSSIPTNIVEGYKRESRKDFLYFLNVANSSLEETKYHLLLTRDLHYISFEQESRLRGKCDEIGKMLYGLRKKVKTTSDK